jgi:hypothetical protein
MKQKWIFLIILTFLGAVGCEKKDAQPDGRGEAASAKAMAACPVCDEKMVEDSYCAGCNAVATTETELVRCEVCDKDFKPGTYCAQCNRFMLNAKVKCANCQGLVVKGHYCPHEKLFKGLPDIAYCEQHRKPYHRSLSCPDCEKEPSPTPPTTPASQRNQGAAYINSIGMKQASASGLIHSVPD